jgi:hypothetical protein
VYLVLAATVVVAVGECNWESSGSGGEACLLILQLPESVCPISSAEMIINDDRCT